MSAHECIGCGQGGAKKPGSLGAYYWFDWLPREKWSPESRYFVICEDCLDRAAKAMFQPKLIARPAGICQGGVSTKRHSDSGTKG